MSINDLTSENSYKNSMSPALGTNGGRSKSNTVFIHFCTGFNGKSLKFDTIAKIKVTSILENPIHKSGPTDNPENYRAICLLDNR